jgi:hypothetical protein
MLVESSFDIPERYISKSNLTTLWTQRKISNFEYLMALNTISGRTYNDLAQYPIFPWIIADYSSDTLNLKDPSIYRDLSKPIGALNPSRLQQFMTRYEAFVDPNIPQFMYGTHYTSPGIVLYYLLRLEPYTTYVTDNVISLTTTLGTSSLCKEATLIMQRECFYRYLAPGTTV